MASFSYINKVCSFIFLKYIYYQTLYFSFSQFHTDVASLLFLQVSISYWFLVENKPPFITLII